MHAPLFGELVVILGLAAGILLLFRRIRLPGILGFIVTGVIAGPHGLGWVHEVESVEAMAEIGVILLLAPELYAALLRRIPITPGLVALRGLVRIALGGAVVGYLLTQG